MDCCEAGDGWYHIRPLADEVYYSSGCAVSVSKTFDGYAACKYKVRYTLMLPREKCTEQGFSRRSGELVPLVIRSEFTIARGSKLVRVHTEIDNTVKDHRLQLHLPTGLAADHYQVNQCNLILSRRCGLDHSRVRWKEADITEYSFENMAFIRDKAQGLLFLSGGGLHEISCPADTENSMDITLLRRFRRTTGTDGERDGQLLGRQVFDYALMPISDESEESWCG